MSDSKRENWLHSHDSTNKTCFYFSGDESRDGDVELEEDNTHTQWTKNLKGFPPEVEFKGEPGLKVFPNHANSDVELGPLDFFQLFVSRDTLKSLKKETNRYLAQTLEGKELKEHSLFKNCSRFTLCEILNFFAIFFHMCIVKKPQIKDYWSQHPVLRSSFAPSIMSRDRFRQLLSMLHLNNNETFVPRGTEGHDPLHKLSPFVSDLRHAFRSVYMPEQKICVDEAICPFRGRIRFRIYMRNKPNKWGIKLYELCESSSGYVYDFEIYTAQPGVSNRPTDVVLRLAEPLFHLEHIIYTDNYYTCPELAEKLAENNTHLVGNVRRNRKGMPTMETKLKKGETDFRRKGSMMVLRWQDTREVNTLTTIHGTGMVHVKSASQEKDKPTCVQDYICNMGGVDLSDQLISYMPFQRKTCKWWKKLYFHLILMAAVNAHVLHNKYRQVKNLGTWSLEDFFATLALQFSDEAGLFQQHQAERREMKEATPVARLAKKHFLSAIPQTGKKKFPTKGCIVCRLKTKKDGKSDAGSRKRKETRYQCRDCGVALCKEPCFELYHTRKHYA